MEHKAKRPADVVFNAIRVTKILTVQIEEDSGDSGKDKSAQSLPTGRSCAAG